MTFTASGAAPNIVITQTGTDTSLAGLVGLAGVTTIKYAGTGAFNQIADNRTSLVFN